MAFTLIDSNTSWQDLAVAQEIATSYNYRRLLCGLSTISAPKVDTEVYDFVLAVQTGIEYMIGAVWLSPSTSLSSLLGQSGFPVPLTEAQAMTAAGLTESGYWRRIADGGTQPAIWTNYSAVGWYYGKIQDKDLAGPWLFKDIQVALSILTRARLNLTSNRIKQFTSEGTAPIPSETVSWDSNVSGTPLSFYQCLKTRTVLGIEAANCNMGCVEAKLVIPDSISTCETGRIVLALAVDNGTDIYEDYTAKTVFNQLDVGDITSYFGQTIEQLSSKSASGGNTTYLSAIAEDFNNSQPLADLILPDSSVPNDTEISIGILITVPYIIIDFSFE